jgi:hypothetical protein
LQVEPADQSFQGIVNGCGDDVMDLIGLDLIADATSHSLSSRLILKGNSLFHPVDTLRKGSIPDSCHLKSHKSHMWNILAIMSLCCISTAIGTDIEQDPTDIAYDYFDAHNRFTFIHDMAELASSELMASVEIVHRVDRPLPDRCWRGWQLRVMQGYVYTRATPIYHHAIGDDLTENHPESLSVYIRTRALIRRSEELNHFYIDLVACGRVIGVGHGFSLKYLNGGDGGESEVVAAMMDALTVGESFDHVASRFPQAQKFITYQSDKMRVCEPVDPVEDALNTRPFRSRRRQRGCFLI